MNNIEKTIFNIKREQIKRVLTGNLGKVIEENNRLICILNRLNYQKDYYGYLVKCEGISKDKIELAEEYGLNKPICYIFENINFRNEYLTIYGEIPCEVIINKCNVENLTINMTGKCTLETLNLIKPSGNLIILADDITLNGVRITNYYYQKKAVGLDVFIKAKNKLIINESMVGKLNENTNIKLFATSKIIINNSTVSADKIRLEAPSIEINGYSEINANKLQIDTNNDEKINAICKVLKR